MKLFLCPAVAKITRTVGLKRLKSNFNFSIQRRNTMTSVAVGQMTSTGNKDENFSTCLNLIESAKSRGVKVLFLPEAFDYMAASKEESVQMAESLNGPLINKFKDLASKHGLWLSLGGFHEKGIVDDAKRICNSHVLINSDGEIEAVYRKCHLFDVTLETGQQLHESHYVVPGKEIVAPVSSPVGKIGLGICYDLRFPEMSTLLTKMGAEILTFPSAFTVSTGKAHWEILLRSRAIENQCYVIAAAQIGTHNAKRASYGHAMIVDPWGTVVAECKDGAEIAVAEIDTSRLQKIRTNMPVQEHRRCDLYGDLHMNSSVSTPHNDASESYQFGQIKLQPSQLFYRTAFTMAFVNKKPVLPGHVLVSPLRCARKFTDLYAEEVNDLFQTVQKVQSVIEKEYATKSATIAIQDGPDAGQSIEHVHVHIIPRKPRDFKHPDLVYVELQNHDKPGAQGKWRTEVDMSAEATKLSKYFQT